MLRSLVGSEMCIRDSSRGTSAPLPHQHGEKKKIYLNIGNETYKAGVHETCLLYTSDAADDLLCVDLGGRRIIKKKKQKIT